ncbi:MAG TPA: hypothetical protein VFR36_03850 [Sphingomicrobium sp.]|nr:hypothetical protein [Sphingomicrobium sp.]
MRTLLVIVMLLSACSQQPASETSIATGTFAGQGRDRLCIVGEPGAYRGGLIAFGQGDGNCSASGRIEAQGDQIVLVPRGEGACRIPMTLEGNVIRIADVPAACAYYCGPGARLAGKAYNRADMGAQAVDLAGDPLC